MDNSARSWDHYWADQQRRFGEPPLLRPVDKEVLALIDRMELTPDVRIVDFGAGTGRLIRELAGRGFKTLIAVDHSSVAVHSCLTLGANVGIIIDLAKIGPVYPPCKVGLAVEVLEHLADPKEALRRMMQWIARDGSLIVTTPHACLGPQHEPTHLHEWTCAQIIDLCEEVGRVVYAHVLRDAYNIDGDATVLMLEHR